MKVVIINRSDNVGGAAVASRRLMCALRDAGIDARMLVADRRTASPHVALMGNRLTRATHFATERLGVWLGNGRRRDTLFKIDTATRGEAAWRHPWVRQADVVVLSWTGQATMSLRGIARLGKPLVWMMHDMWNCTGLCHHAGECTAYHATCHSCPLLGGRDGDDLSTLTQRRKRQLYESTPITFVAVSHWLADCCRASSLMRDADVRVVCNPIKAGEFACSHIEGGIEGLPAGKQVLVMGAARLDDPVKGFDRLIAATRHIAQLKPELAQKVHLVLYGDIRDRSLLGQIAIPCTWLGPIGDINGVMRHAHVVLSTSRYESFGQTLVEGMASGCVPVTFGNSGQRDIVEHLANGYLAREADVADFVRGIEWALQCGLSREQQHEAAIARFDAPHIAQQYIEIFKSLINKSL